MVLLVAVFTADVPIFVLTTPRLNNFKSPLVYVALSCSTRVDVLNGMDEAPPAVRNERAIQLFDSLNKEPNVLTAPI